MPSEKRIRIRCSEETKKEWQRVSNELAPFGDQEDAIERIIGAVDANPELFKKNFR